MGQSIVGDKGLVEGVGFVEGRRRGAAFVEGPMHCLGY